MSRLAHLAMYTEASTANPLGNRPFQFWLQNPATAPRSAPNMSGYYPSAFVVPTPGNITMRSQANVLAGLGYGGLTGLGQAAPAPPSILSVLSDPDTLQTLLLGGAAIALLWALKSGRKRRR